MHDNDKISIGQLIFILVQTMVGAGMVTLPRELAEAIDYDYWIIVLIGGAIVLGITFCNIYTIKSNPGKGYFEILCKAFGKPLAYIIGFAYIVSMTVNLGMILRVFGNVVKMYLLSSTPIEVIMITMLISCVYLVRRGVEVLGRMYEFLFVFIITAGVSVFVFSFTKSSFSSILPVFQLNFTDILKATPVTIFSFTGFEMLLFFGVYLNKPKQIGKSYIAILIVVGFYVLLMLATIAEFGSIQVKNMIWPTMDLFDTIEPPGLFIENIQVILMALWVPVVFTTLASTYLAMVIMLKSLMKTRDHSYLAVPFLPMIYMVAILPENTAENFKMIQFHSKYMASIVVFIIPLLVFASIFIQKRFGRGAKVNG